MKLKSIFQRMGQPSSAQHGQLRSTVMPQLSFTGFRFELIGVGPKAAKDAGFHWDLKKQVNWTSLIGIAKKFTHYADYSAKQRFEEEASRRKRDLEEWPIRHRELMERFLEITERKVSFLDEYGDENWNALPKEIERLLSKAAKVDRDDIDPIKRMVLKGLTAEEVLWEMSMPKIGRRPQLLNKGFSDDVLDALIRKYTFLCSDLETRFRAYHASQKDKGLTEDIESLTGLEFQMYLMKLLKEHGFDDIRTTGTGGDQGADLIGKLKGRSIVIQAKRQGRSVGNRAVQEVAAAVRYYRADEAWVITAGTFTASAKALAQANNVKLVDGHALRNRCFPLT